MPIDYIRRIHEIYARRGAQPYQFAAHDSAPLVPLKKPLSQCRVALISSGGV